MAIDEPHQTVITGDSIGQIKVFEIEEALNEEVSLKVTVIEADSILSADANGFSDPYARVIAPFLPFVYVCMYVNVYICMFMTQSCTRIRTNDDPCLSPFVCVFMYVHVCVCMYVYVYVCSCAWRL